MDPLSDVLSLLKPRSYSAGGFDVSGDWSIEFPRHQGIKCYAIVSGKCWLSMEDVPDHLHLATGDCFLLPRGRSFRLSKDPKLRPVDYRVVLANRVGGIGMIDGGGDCLIAGGHFALSGDYADMLRGMLPPIVHIRKEADKAALRWSLDRMRQELIDPQPGGVLIAQQLAYMLLVQALRLYIAERPIGGVGWLFALADKQMSAAMSAMHADPAHRWTLLELAEHAGMSRSTFALRFKETVGTSPMDYLTNWRMSLAGDRLANTNQSIAAIALSLGYESESAFSTAFKRVMACSPRQYARRQNDDASPTEQGKGVITRVDVLAEAAG